MPKDNQVLVKVRSASANTLGYRGFEKLSTMGNHMEERFIKSVGKALGADISGVVGSVGASVMQFQPGEEVYGVSASSVGGFAEYTYAPENNLALKPTNISFEAAAAVPTAALTALQALRDKGHIKPGQKVLITGASGGIGTFAMQIAKSFGAEVTAVCSTQNLELARSIGADHIIDYTRENFIKNGQRYDLILAVNGYHSILDYKRTLNPEGIYIAAGGSMLQVFQVMIFGPLLSRRGSKTLSFIGLAKVNQKNLVVIRELLESGNVVPVINRSYRLSEVPEAIRYLVEEHAKWKVAITIGHDNK